jgi:5'-nucleotidase/UDP-sugar diphosphatase
VIASQAPSAADSRWELITILHTNDLHGAVMPRTGAGGLERAATLIRQVRAEMPNVILLDGGDIIHGTTEDYLLGHTATISAMNAAGYDLAVAGNHEYDFGLATLDSVTKTAAFPFVAANVRSASGGDANGIRRYVVIQVSGVRIGILGLTTLDTITLEWPAAIKDIKIEDPFETARALMPEVTAQSDVVVVLSHLGAAEDRRLAKEVPGIDFIVGGHSHTPIRDWEWIGNTLITQAAPSAAALGRIDFIVKKSDPRGQIWSVNGKGRKWNDLPQRPLWKTYPDAPLLQVGSDVAEDNAVRKAYMPYRTAADARLAEVIAQAPAAIPGRSIGADESSAADVVADAVRAFGKSDLAVIDINGIGSRGLAAGPVTVGNVLDLIGGYTRQQIVVGQVLGKDIITALDAGFARKNAINVTLSGASLEYERNGGTPRVAKISIAGVAIDPERQYTVATQAYVMMDLMNVISNVSITAEPAETTREALVSYVRSCGTIVAPNCDRVKKNELAH